MNEHGWHWPIAPVMEQHRERIALMREIQYETTSPIDEEEEPPPHQGVRQLGKALSLNVSSGGILLMMEGAPEPEQVLRLHVPTPAPEVSTPTLAEVRWTRSVPFHEHQMLYFVGFRFLL